MLNENEASQVYKIVHPIKIYCDASFWVQSTSDSASAFKQLENLLIGCTKKFCADEYLSNEKIVLQSRQSVDSIVSTVWLSRDLLNIIQAEVALKYLRPVVGGYRGLAKPESTWRLGQLQDCLNYLFFALHSLRKGEKFFEDYMRLRENDVKRGHEILLEVFQTVKKQVKLSIDSLMKPRKKSLTELFNFPPIKSFSPSLPEDIVFSFYISSHKLIISAYHIIPTQGEAQTVTVYQAESNISRLKELMELLNASYTLLQEFIANKFS